MKSVSNPGRTHGDQSPSRNGWLSKAISAAALAVACTLVACDSNYTIAYVYAPSASLSSGLINAYRIDNQTGQLHLLPDSPVPSGGRKPVAVVATPADEDVPAIFVIHHDDSNVVSFLIGRDGKLYPQETLDTGSFPTANWGRRLTSPSVALLWASQSATPETLFLLLPRTPPR